MVEDGDSSVKIDIGAKLSAELKAEVSKESVGRVVDALLDVIRPFTERRGLIADNVRLQRAEVAYKIAKLALESAQLEHLALNPPPLKFTVPFLEKASLEDQDEELHARWSALLVSASTHYDARHLTFTDIMTRLSSDELKLIEEVCLSQASFPEVYHPDGHITENQRNVTELSRRMHFGHMPVPKETRDHFTIYIAENPLHYGRYLYAQAVSAYGGPMLYTEYGVADTPTFRSLEILERERLITMRKVDFTGGVTIGYFDMTFMGINFVKDCSPKAREAIRRYNETFIKRVVSVRPDSDEER
jgi:Abortive infection alpha